MLNFKNIIVGFVVSFIGSIPLGYLNIIGFKLYQSQGFYSTILYLLGVIIVEFFVIYGTLIFAKKLTNNSKLIKFIEAFSIIFMFILAYIFYSSSQSEKSNEIIFSNYAYYPLLFGLILSAVNFIQIPFWLSWNLYLLNGQYIQTTNNKKFYFLSGTIFGTFSGMLVLIISLSYFTTNFDFLSKYLMMIIIPLIFILLGIFQAYKFYIKYSK